jgi:hypothetical protein
MENSSKMLFGEDAPHWYVALGQKYAGPMRASDIFEKIAGHQLTTAHYAWKKGQSEWKRICDIKAFQSLVPRQPEKDIQKQIVSDNASHKSSPSVKMAAQARSWYLYQNNSQFGPFSMEELKNALKTGRISQRIHTWRYGMKTWERIERVAEFHESLVSAGGNQKASHHSKVKVEAKVEVEEQRQHPRRPLIAKILMSDQESVIVGVCRDISIGGLQVLTDTVPGDVGTRLKMNISPSSNEGENPIEPFVAEGLIVRILEDGRGFSFRFVKIGDRAKQSIELYVDSST